MSPSKKRILAALGRRPMTMNEMAACIFVSINHLHHVVRELHDAGLIRKGRQAPRVFTRGATPRYWEIAA